MPASISSTFMIEFNQAAGTGTATITNPGRTFKVIGAFGTGLDTSVITVRKNTGAGAIVAVCTLAAGDLDDFPSVITTANASFLATDNIHITIATANATAMKLLCMASDSQSLTVA